MFFERLYLQVYAQERKSKSRNKKPRVTHSKGQEGVEGVGGDLEAHSSALEGKVTVLHLSFPKPRVMDQHKLSRDQWEDRIQVWHAEHRGMLK